ncbi:MAG: hypothetical protein ACI9TH_002025 [Kiritimatiellia bacterium]|jgi:uncharacterized protein (DUF58 family)
MIAPTRRFMWVVALGILPPAALGAFFPPFAALAILATVLIIAGAIYDAATNLKWWTGLTLTFPKTIRLTSRIEGDLTCTVEDTRKRKLNLRIGFTSAPGLGLKQDILEARLTPEKSAILKSWKCCPYRRGRIVIEHAYLETDSRLKLWHVRGRMPVACEIKVYPNLGSDRKSASAAFLNRGRVGEKSIRQIGKGREFEMLREYMHGDSYEDIHWRATAKRRSPVTKVFQIERTQEVYVIVDSSRLSARRPGGYTRDREIAEEVLPEQESLLERYITAAMLLHQVAHHQGDLFGLLVFDDRVKNFVRARGGKAHYSACAEALYTLQPNMVTPDFEELFSFIRLRLRKRALLIFLTNLDDPVIAESFSKHVEMISRQHLVMINVITPKGVEPLFGKTEVNDLDDIYLQLAYHFQWEQIRDLEKSLKTSGVHLQQLTNERACADIISQYMQVKQKQML